MSKYMVNCYKKLIGTRLDHYKCFVPPCGQHSADPLWKIETVTPAPKVYPPQSPNDLRKISGTLNFSKIYEKFLAEVMISDMTPSSDPSQYGNEKGIGTQHYLIKMIN